MNPVVMGILNITPDSFSDGGKFVSVDSALKRAEEMIAEGVEIIDIGGESTRPGSERVDETTEIARVVPVIEAITSRFDVPVSIDTSKSAVAEAAITAGAEIINDISGLRWDPQIANVAAALGAGIVLMHSRGDFETMHSQPPAADIIFDVTVDLRYACETAARHGVKNENISLDIGIGFGKTFEQNLELIANLDRLVREFSDFPLLVGASRKSFIGKILGGLPANDRLGGSLAAAVVSVMNGARIVRVHDVRETVAAIRVLDAIESNA